MTYIDSKAERIGLIERRDTYQEAISAGAMRIEVPHSIAKRLHVDIDTLKACILTSPWRLPLIDFKNRIPLKGSSGKPVSSTSIQIERTDGSPFWVDVVSKKTDSFEKACEELGNYERVGSMGQVKTLNPFAAIEVVLGKVPHSWVLTRLEKGVLPIERIEIANLIPGDQTTFLKELAAFSAAMANNGISHGDYIARNIGYDLSQLGRPSSPEFLLYDLESCRVTPRHIHLAMLDLEGKIPYEQAIEFNRVAFRYLDDIVDLFDSLSRLKKIPKRRLAHDLVDPYVESRIPMRGRLSPKAEIKYITTGRIDLS